MPSNDKHYEEQKVRKGARSAVSAGYQAWGLQFHGFEAWSKKALLTRNI